jgi:hypothetical protein
MWQTTCSGDNKKINLVWICTLVRSDTIRFFAVSRIAKKFNEYLFVIRSITLKFTQKIVSVSIIWCVLTGQFFYLNAMEWLHFINIDLAQLKEEWKIVCVIFESSKSQAMVHFRKLLYYLILPSVIINSAAIPYSTRLENLGMVMSCGLTWEGQIFNVLQKVYVMYCEGHS